MINKHKELVEACALNDRNAQMEIYDLYYSTMYNTSLRIVNDPFIAEDIMQEAFLDAFTKVTTFEWRSSFGAWLKRIVVNKSIDSIKKIDHEIPFNEEVVEVPVENYDHDFENIQFQLDEVRMAIKRISKNYKIVLVLHLFEGYDHQEISQILNIPYNNVRVRYLRAKRKLLEEIIKSRD
ncbi:MAG: RNA polymerase sigma factor [Bacteroidetes bacterium]|nr:RNA polymerase sigma factor [Bacteroidota bacterium]MBL6942960.1 RNA polymerase sigma factor [Bacteroidales bacterium]